MLAPTRPSQPSKHDEDHDDEQETCAAQCGKDGRFNGVSLVHGIHDREDPKAGRKSCEGNEEGKFGPGEEMLSASHVVYRTPFDIALACLKICEAMAAHGQGREWS